MRHNIIFSLGKCIYRVLNAYFENYWVLNTLAVAKWPKMAEIPENVGYRFFNAFHSKNSAFIKSYSTLCETQMYFELVKMYLLSLKFIFRNLLGPQIPFGAKMTKSVKVAKFSTFCFYYLSMLFHFWYVAIILRHVLVNLTFSRK